MPGSIDDASPARTAAAVPGPGDPVGAAALEILDAFPAYTDLLWRRCAAIAPVGGRVLEMGCGIGSITRRILALPGIEGVDAVDPNPLYVERVRSEIADPRLRVFLGTAEAFRPPGAPYRAVVCINVLEHVEDDAAALANFRSALEPGGECLLLVPAHPWLYSSLDAGLSHYRRYSRRGLEALARGTGLEPLRAVHFNPLGALGWWLNGKALRRRALPAGQVKAYSRFLISASRIADRLCPLPLGISLIARLRRA